MRSATKRGRAVAGFGALLALGCTSSVDVPAAPTSAAFSPATECANCHVKISKQHAESMHASAFENPVFQALYYDDFLAGLHEAPDSFKDEPPCLGCHAPVAYMKHRFMAGRKQGGVMVAGDDCGACHPSSVEEVNVSREGVACDFCHRILGYKGEQPGNGNYIARPGQPKLGPFKSNSDWHRAYGELQTKSEFCAICHSSNNRHGVATRSTYTEWKQSRFAKEGIQCQDCHMNLQGFLTDGKPIYERGRAATMTLGEAPERDRLYTHRFFGAHSSSQIEGALKLDIDVLWPVIQANTNVPVQLTIHNDKTGHRMPTGSAELRVVWLDVVARVDDLVIPLKYGGDMSAFNVSGGRGADDAIYGDAIPAGRRLYHAVFVDGRKRRTFNSYDATARIFDNRLEAGEARRESYYLRVPRGLSGRVEIEATLYYLRYPAAFSQRLGLPDAKPVAFAQAKRAIEITPK